MEMGVYRTPVVYDYPFNFLLWQNDPIDDLNFCFAPGTYSTLHVDFQLKRHMGYFLINTYVPCTLIVIISWVNFWINREATADRVSLGK